MEYKPFGAGWVQRESHEYPWEPVPPDDVGIARAAILEEQLAAAENRAASAGKLGVVITRSDLTRSIANELGLTADELAERLARPDDNQGTRIRLPDDKFDQLMNSLGLSPEEARARFKGTYWE